MKNQPTQLNNYSDMIGVKIIRVSDNASGIITDVLYNGSIFPVGYMVEINGNKKQEEIGKYDFYIDIKLEEGKKYKICSGEVVTMHKKNGRFFVKYSEHWGIDNTSTESYEENGIAYHYDCGMNVLKEVM